MTEWTVGLVTALIAVVGVLALALLAFVAWREVEHRKQIDALTSKIMARDYREYAVLRPQELTPAQPPTNEPKLKRVVDPHLGAHF